MKRSRNIASSWLLLLTTIAGCYQTQQNESYNRDYIPREEYANAKVDALCNNVEKCCELKGLSFIRKDIRKNCREIQEANAPFSIENMLYGDLEGIGYDGVAAANCLKNTVEYVSGCGNEMDASNSMSCPNVFSPTVKLGEKCRSSFECVTDRYGETFCADGVCTVARTREPGEPCTHIEECIEPEESEQFALCTDGICVVERLTQWTRLEEGEDCEGSCNDSRERNGDRASCKGLGDFGACYSTDGLYCDDIHGVCRPLLAVGDHCRPENQEGCGEEAYCGDGICSLRKGAGQSCNMYRECDDDTFCDESGKCSPPKARGEPCGVSQGRCQPGLVCYGVCAGEDYSLFDVLCGVR